MNDLPFLSMPISFLFYLHLVEFQGVPENGVMS
jgi:hypothetical protein